MHTALSFRLWKAATLLLVFYLLGWVFVTESAAQAGPRYQVDPSWPKPLPNKWALATITGIFVDKNDRIWMLHRPRQVATDDSGAYPNPPAAECCVPGPSIIAFDTEGNVVKSLGGPEHLPQWPILEHGLFIDKEGNFWIAGTYVKGLSEGNRGVGNLLTAPIPKPKEMVSDRHVLKLSPEGKLLLQIGHPSDAPANNADTSILGAAVEVFVDDGAHEVYIADGFINQRIVVYDSNTGAFKRGWGGYGIPLSEIENRPLGYAKDKPPAHDPAKPQKQFEGEMFGIEVSEDGLVYVGDRAGDRIQVFTKEGKFVKEFLVAPQTFGWGSVWGVKLSRDSGQKYIYVADAYNGKVRILNREDGKEVGSFGHKGTQAGQFNGLESVAVDSRGNVYTAEVAPNRRVQRFVPVK